VHAFLQWALCIEGRKWSAPAPARCKKACHACAHHPCDHVSHQSFALVSGIQPGYAAQRGPRDSSMAVLKLCGAEQGSVRIARRKFSPSPCKAPRRQIFPGCSPCCALCVYCPCPLQILRGTPEMQGLCSSSSAPGRAGCPAPASGCFKRASAIPGALHRPAEPARRARRSALRPGSGALLFPGMPSWHRGRCSECQQQRRLAVPAVHPGRQRSGDVESICIIPPLPYCLMWAQWGHAE
jgi:hypothetical protein